ncbi:MAG: carboxypeptidase-like regulatory domain-containing protein, partial [Gemmatimonadota bacterium]
MMNRYRDIVALLTAGWCLSAGPIEAQAPKGIIRGVVMGSKERRPIEGARVSLVGADAVTVTDEKGRFQFENLIPGRYVIQASAIGYSQLTSPVVLRSSQTLDIEFEADAEAVNL